jgi:RHS repeat-associated protein
VGAARFLNPTGAAGSRTVLTDALGSTIALADPAGAIKTQYSYEPYGTTTATGEADANSQQYTGRDNDGTGLYYYRARYYHTGLPRFISEDPIGFAAGDPNLYAYGFASPTTFTDPTGLSTTEICINLNIQVVLGFGLRGCIGIDDKGFAVTGSVSGQFGLSLAANLTTGVQFSNATYFEQLRGGPAYGLTVGFGEGFVGQFEALSDFKTRNCDNELVVTGYAGAGIGVNINPLPVPASAAATASKTGVHRLSGQGTCLLYPDYNYSNPGVAIGGRK